MRRSGRQLSGNVRSSGAPSKGAQVTPQVVKSSATATGSESRKAPGEIGTRLGCQVGAPGSTALSRAVDSTSPSRVVEFAHPGRSVRTEECTEQTQNISRTAGYRGMQTESRSTSGVGWSADKLSRPPASIAADLGVEGTPHSDI